MGRFLTAHQHN